MRFANTRHRPRPPRALVLLLVAPLVIGCASRRTASTRQPTGDELIAIGKTFESQGLTKLSRRTYERAAADPATSRQAGRLLAGLDGTIAPAAVPEAIPERTTTRLAARSTTGGLRTNDASAWGGAVALGTTTARVASDLPPRVLDRSELDASTTLASGSADDPADLPPLPTVGPPRKRPRPVRQVAAHETDSPAARTSGEAADSTESPGWRPTSSRRSRTVLADDRPHEDVARPIPRSQPVRPNPKASSALSAGDEGSTAERVAVREPVYELEIRPGPRGSSRRLQVATYEDVGDVDLDEDLELVGHDELEIVDAEPIVGWRIGNRVIVTGTRETAEVAPATTRGGNGRASTSPESSASEQRPAN